MAQGQVFDIPENGWPWVKNELEKLQKKAAKLTDDKVVFMVIGKHDKPHPRNKMPGAVEIFYEVFISAPEIKLNGWEIVATFDHDLDAGSIIRQAPGHTLPIHLYDRPPECEHCGINRRRNSTFFLKCEDTYKQVGRTCLTDFTGHKSPEKLIRAAELYSHIQGIIRVATHGLNRNGDADARMITTEYAANEVASKIISQGYTSIKEARDHHNIQSSTAYQTKIWWGQSGEDWKPNALHLAESALEWARNIDVTNSWHHNIRVLADSPTMDYKHLNLMASLVGTYFKLNSKAKPISTHQGKLGQRLPSTKMELTRVSQAQFGMRHAFKDEAGNIYVWFKDTQEHTDSVGKTFLVEGKVRQHSTFGGVQQTDLNYFRISKVD